MSKNQPSWLRLSFDMWRAGFEAQQVIGLRLAKLMGGGAPVAAALPAPGFRQEGRSKTQ